MFYERSIRLLADMDEVERAVAVATVREMLQIELTDHEDSTLRLETSELPDELRVALDDLAIVSGRLTYSVVPSLSPIEDTSRDDP